MKAKPAKSKAKKQVASTKARGWEGQGQLAVTRENQWRYCSMRSSDCRRTAELLTVMDDGVWREVSLLPREPPSPCHLAGL